MAQFGNRNYDRPSFFGGFQFFPPVIKWLLILNGGVFLFMLFVGNVFTLGGMPVSHFLTKYFALMPVASDHFYLWQLITYQFMHAGFWHIFFNMFFGLWMFGMELANIWGPRKFLTYYLLCGVVAGLFQLFLSPILEPGSAMAPTVGASGAVYGVMVAFAMYFPDRPLYLYFFVPVKAKYFIIFLIALGIFSVGGSSNVANLAHLGGAAAGFLFVMLDRIGAFSRFDTSAISSFGKAIGGTFSSGSKRQSAPIYDIRDAQVKDVEEPSEIDPDKLAQKKIDEILDKISKGGYKSLTDEEKRILFEASKRIN